jgi:hypothetical protein
MGPINPQFRCLKFEKSQNIKLFKKKLIVKVKLVIQCFTIVTKYCKLFLF